MQPRPRLLTYTPELDGLRGIAIALVMIAHAGVQSFKGGFVGVDIFLVLSGFLITYLLVREFELFGSINFLNFYMRRFLRLAPALILMLITFCIVSRLMFEQPRIQRNDTDALIALFYLSNWAIVLDLHRPDWLGHTWSLSLEEQFYLLWPVLLSLLLMIIRERRTIIFCCLFLAGASWAFRVFLHYHSATPERLLSGLGTRSEPLMLGCAIAIIATAGFFDKDTTKAFLTKYAAPLTLLAIIAIGFMTVFANWRSPQMFCYGFIIIEAATAILVIAIITGQTTLTARLLGASPLVWIGKISYGLYLWHYPIYRIMMARGATTTTVLILGSTLTLIATVASYYILEKPILKLKSRFVQRPVAPTTA